MEMPDHVTVESVRFLTSQQAVDLERIAEQVRTALSHLAEETVGYDVTALQLLDEWIERYLRRRPTPTYRVRLAWASFLGQILCARHQGRWIIKKEIDRSDTLAVSCPTADGTFRTIDVVEAVDRRINEGIAASLTMLYTTVGIVLRADRQPDW
jgi:hypothetical protein